MHWLPFLLKSGDFEYFIPKFYTEEEADELKMKLEEHDPKQDRLKTLNEDKENLWIS